MRPTSRIFNVTSLLRLVLAWITGRKIGLSPLVACACTQKTKGCPNLERKVETKFTRLIGTTFRFFCAGACDQGGGPDFPTGNP